jgi:hypothetical protein
MRAVSRTSARPSPSRRAEGQNLRLIRRDAREHHTPAFIKQSKNARQGKLRRHDRGAPNLSPRKSERMYFRQDGRMCRPSRNDHDRITKVTKCFGFVFSKKNRFLP